jgi:hypothetical protein
VPPSEEEIAELRSSMEPIQVEGLIARRLARWFELNSRGFAKEVEKDSFQAVVNVGVLSVYPV